MMNVEYGGPRVLQPYHIGNSDFQQWNPMAYCNVTVLLDNHTENGPPEVVLPCLEVGKSRLNQAMNRISKFLVGALTAAAAACIYDENNPEKIE